MTPEGTVKDQTKKALAAAKLFSFVPPVGGYGKRGISDFIVLYRGCVLFIETKATSKRKRRYSQVLFSDEVGMHGCPYWLIHAGNIMELPMLLRDFKEEIDQCFSNSSLPAAKK